MYAAQYGNFHHARATLNEAAGGGLATCAVCGSCAARCAHDVDIARKIEELKVEGIKAIFFVKDLGGDKGHKKTYEDNVPGGGKKIQVEFHDGETIVGYVLGYSPERQGFFMTPADLEGNNLRIYAVAAAVKKTQFL